MTDIYDMDNDQFTALLTQQTTPAEVFTNAANIYDFLTAITGQRCMDSVLREWAFEWATTGLNIPYDDIYDKWLGEEL